MNTERLTPWLFGHDRALSRWYARVAAGIFFLGLALYAVLWVLAALAISVDLEGSAVLWTLGLVAVGPATLAAYQNDGLVVCWALGAALPAALFLVPAASPGTASALPAGWGVTNGLGSGLVAGTVGFVLGAGGRRAWRLFFPDLDALDGEAGRR